jgi:hypothetical protein
MYTSMVTQARFKSLLLEAIHMELMAREEGAE